MDHGWDSYYNYLPPLPSDTELLRRIPESDGTLSQGMENYIGQLSSSSTVAFPNPPVPPSNVNVNYSPNEDIVKLNSLNGCQEDFNDCHYHQKGEQTKELCPSRDVSEFTRGLKISSSENFHGETQECERQSASIMENETNVNNYPEYLSESDLSNYVASNLIPQVGNEAQEELDLSELLAPIGEKKFQDLGENDTQIDRIQPSTRKLSLVPCTENEMETPKIKEAGKISIENECIQKPEDDKNIPAPNSTFPDCEYSLEKQVKQGANLPEDTGAHSQNSFKCEDFNRVLDNTGPKEPQSDKDRKDLYTGDGNKCLSEMKQEENNTPQSKNWANLREKETHSQCNSSRTPNCTAFQGENVEVKFDEKLFSMDSFQASSPQSIEKDTVQENSPKNLGSSHQLNHFKHNETGLLDSEPQLDRGISQDNILTNMVEKLEGHSTCSTASILSEVLLKSNEIPKFESVSSTELGLTRSAFCPHTTESEATHGEKNLQFEQAVKQKDKAESNFTPRPPDSPSGVCDNSQNKLFEPCRHLPKKNVAHDSECTIPQQKDEECIIPEYKGLENSNSIKQYEEIESKNHYETSTASQSPFLNFSDSQNQNFKDNSLENKLSANIFRFPNKQAVEEAPSKENKEETLILKSQDDPSFSHASCTDGEHLEQSKNTTNSSIKDTDGKSESSCMESCMLPVNSVSTVENESFSATDSDSTVPQDISIIEKFLCEEKDQIAPLRTSTSTLQTEDVNGEKNFARHGETSFVQRQAVTVKDPNFDEENTGEEAVSNDVSNTSAQSYFETECTQAQGNSTTVMSCDQLSLHDSALQESSECETFTPVAFGPINLPVPATLCKSQLEQGSRYASETDVTPSLSNNKVIDGHEEDHKVTTKDQEPQMKSPVQMKKALQPVVILTAMESIEVSRSYCCANCRYSTDIVDDLIEHHHSRHSTDNIQFCKTCHSYQLKKEPFEEHICGVEMKTPLSLKSFLYGKKSKFRRNQMIKTRFKCDKCGLYYASTCTLWRHKKIPGRCKQGILPIASFPSTNIEQNSSNEKKQPCQIKLVDIFQTRKCVLCDEKFPDVPSLKEHCHIVHKLDTLSDSSKPSIKKTSNSNFHTKPNEVLGKHKCLLCSRAFKYSFNRNRHLRDCVKATIQGGKMRENGKYWCPLCKSSFATSETRRKHIKFVCLKKSINLITNCKVAKNQAAPEIKKKEDHEPLAKHEELKSHQMPDDEETPAQQNIRPKDRVRHFKCQFCPAAFCHASGKYRHMKKHELYKLTGKTIKYRNTHSSSVLINKSSTKQTKPSESGPRSTDKVHKVFNCQFCGKGFNSLKYKSNHELNHRGERPYQCLECGKGFKNIHHLNSHKSIHQRRIQCTVCAKIVSSISDLIQHRKQHSVRGMLQCPDCPLQFQYPVHLLRHVESHMKKEKTSQVKPVKSSKPEELTESLGDNNGAQLQCSICKDMFADGQVLRKHCLTHISESSSNQCPFCRSSFKSRPNLLRHMIKHTKDQAPSCTTQVGNPTSLNPDSKKPLVSNTSSYSYRYTCRICPRRFCKKERLKRHLLAHRKKTLFLCANCGQYFGINQIKHHREECTQPPKDNISVSSPDKASSQMAQSMQKMVLQPKATNSFPFQCSHCSMTFKFRSLLDRHLVSHTGLLPYACKQCGHRYRSRSACLQHEVFCSTAEKEEVPKSQHESEDCKQPNSQMEKRKEFKCKFCTKTFTKPRLLRNHILTHNEVKPYRCKACNSCFSRYDHLKVHQTHCNGEIQHLEVRIPKVSSEDIGMGWKKRFGFASSEKKRFKCINCYSTFSHEKTLKRHKKLRICRRSSKKASNDSPVGIEHSATIGKMTHHVMKDKPLERIQPYLKKNHRFQCSYCPRTFPRPWHLLCHTRVHTGEKPFPCNHCGEMFARKDYLKRHYPKCSMIQKMLCHGCGDTFSSREFENHIKDCKASLSTKSTVAELQETSKENRIKGFSCAYCSHKFLIFSQLQEHFTTAHKMETAEESGSSATLQHHLSNIPKDENEGSLESVGERANLICNLDFPFDNEISKYWCSICKISFSSKSELSAHKSTHPIKLPHSCRKCNKGFWKKALLRNHDKKCKKPTRKESQAVVDKDSVLVFKDGSDNTGSGVVRTNFTCKDGSTDQIPQDSEENQKCTSSQTKKTVHYQCSECEKSFTDGLLLISHLEDHGREEQARKHNICPRCGKVCANQGTLLRHLKTHENTKLLSLLERPKNDLTFSKLETKRQNGDTARLFSCKLCSQQFLTNKSLYTHYRKEHYNDVFPCKICNKAYATKMSLVRHYREAHQKEAKELSDVDQEEIDYIQQLTDEFHASDESDENHNITSEDSDSDAAPYFPCHVCGKTFTTSESLEDHQLCHLGKKPFECSECGKCFILASQLHQHERMHKSEFQCQTCGRGFVTFFALRKHKHTHGKARPHRCSKCQLSFKCLSQLSEHMSTHKEDNFPCDICERAFLSKNLRDEHRKIHASVTTDLLRSDAQQSSSIIDTSSVVSRVLKYRCGVCCVPFKDREDLSEHGCLKAQERPYSCLDCDKHFLHLSHLLKHKNTHQQPLSNTKYSCNQCKVSFTCNAFIKHLNSHVEINESIKQESDDEDDGPLPTFICPVCNQSFTSAADVIPHFTSHLDGPCENKKQKLMDENESQNQTPTLKFKHSQCSQSISGTHSSHQQHGIAQNERTPSSTQSHSSHYQSMEDEVDVTGDDTFNCLPCSLQFSSKSSLLEHQNREHSIEKPYKCGVCKRSFAKMSYLRKHERRQHRQANSTIACSEKKKFNCTRCKTSFSALHDLNLHMRSHAEKEVGAFRCDMCYKSFSQLSHLRKHQESHVGEVVYECTECDKVFAFPHLLEEHRQSHGTSSHEG